MQDVLVQWRCCNGVTYWDIVIKDQHSSVVILACETEEICVDPTLSEAFAMARWLQIARNQDSKPVFCSH